MRRRVIAIVVTLGALIVVSTVAFIGYRKAVFASLEPPVPPQLETCSKGFADLARSAIDDVRATPGDHERWLKLGMIYEANQFMELAESCYATAVDLDGGAQANYRLAVMHGQLGNLDGAVEFMQRTIAMDDSHGPAHWHLGFWLLDLNRLDEAESAFVAAMSRRAGPYDLAGEIGLARLAIMRGDLERAESILRTILARPSPYSAYANHLLGTTYARMGLENEAKMALARGRAAEPVFPDALQEQINAYRLDTEWMVTHAKSLVTHGDFSGAIALLEQAAKDDPGDLLVTNNLAITYCAAGRNDESVALLERVLHDQPGSFQGHFNMALALRSRASLAQGEDAQALRDGAAQHLDEALRLNPTFSGALGMKAEMLRQDGRFDEALDLCFQALASEPASEMWWRLAAMTAMDAGQPARALECAQQLRALRLGDPQVESLLRDIASKQTGGQATTIPVPSRTHSGDQQP